MKKMEKKGSKTSLKNSSFIYPSTLLLHIKHVKHSKVYYEALDMNDASVL